MGKTKDVSHQELMEVINSFDFGGKLEEVGIFGNGHINETYCAVFSTEAGQKRYILQKMNKQIFKDPVGLMENISGVTSWLKKKILENGGDAERETLNIVNDRAGAPYFVDKEGEYWRAYLFIEALIRWKMTRIFTRVLLHLVISSAFLLIIRQILFMRQSRIFIIQ